MRLDYYDAGPRSRGEVDAAEEGGAPIQTRSLEPRRSRGAARPESDHRRRSSPSLNELIDLDATRLNALRTHVPQRGVDHPAGRGGAAVT